MIAAIAFLVAAIAGLYALGVAVMLFGGLTLARDGVAALARGIDCSFAAALLLGALLWPLLGRAGWKATWL